MKLIDAYLHVALPRFLSLDHALRLMDEHGVDAAVLSTAETCPDIHGMLHAITRHPDRFRAVGMPLGEDDPAIARNIRTQLDAGFSGIRMPAALIARNPALLEPIGAAGGCAIVVGPHGLREAAGPVADFLDRHPDSFVIAGHFGGPADPALLDTDAAARLYDHPRLHVAFTRHGAMAGLPVEAWARALLARIGWSRALWGSEWPVALWRNETYRSTLDWPLRFGPSEADLRSFRCENVRRLFFAKAIAPTRFAPPLDLMPFRRDADVWLFPPSLDLSEQRHQAIHAAYLAWGGEARASYAEFALAMIEQGIAAIPQTRTPETAS